MNKMTKPTVKIPIENFEKVHHNSDYKKSKLAIEGRARITTFSSMISDESVLSIAECGEHGKPLEISCKTCRFDICVDCALFFDHRGHNIERYETERSISRAPNKAFLDLKEKAENLLEKSKKVFDKVKIDISNKKEGLNNIIDQGFDELKNDLEKARTSAVASVSSYYQDFSNSLRSNHETVERKIEAFILSLSKSAKSKDILVKEFQNIQKLFESKILSDSFERDSLKITFDTALPSSLKHFCKSSTDKRASTRNSVVRITEEDSLLQDSLNESAFKDIGDTATVLEEKPVIPFLQTQKSYARIIKSGSFAPGHFAKPSMPQDYKFSVCEPSLHMRSQASGSIFKIDEEMITKTSNNFGSAFQTRASNTPKAEDFAKRGFESSRGPPKTPKGPSRLKTESNLLSDRSPLVQRFENSPNKRQTSRANNQVIPETQTSQKLQSSKIIPKSMSINLASAGFDDFKIEAYFRKSPITPGIKSINLSCNQITDRGLKSILKLMTANFIETLFLTDNQLRERSLDYLLSFAKYNTILKSVFLQENRIDQQSLDVKNKVFQLKRVGIQVFL
jgi:hypothetical protein